VFLAGNAAAGLLWSAAGAVLATALAVGIRWRWDGRQPWLAVATLVLALLLTAIGIVLDDETFVLVRPTVGAAAFASVLAIGALARPSLLERTLAYRLRIDASGWRVLHVVWIALALLSAGANEVARRILSTDHWALYNVLSDPVLIGLVWVGTRTVAVRHWIDE
jgi:intracellular septation protein